jgi:pimeloyl-ACP methyl ester carboxylesterase
MKSHDIKVRSGKYLLTATICKSEEGGREKLAVLLPGFLDSKNYRGIAQLAEDVTELGFTSVRFDPTGTWESEGKIEEYSISQYLKDVEAVVDFMIKQNGKPFKAMVILGHSLGALMSILYGAKDEKVSGVVSIMPPQSFVRPDNFKDRVIKWKKDGEKVSTRDLPEDRNTFRKYPVPFSFVEDAMKYDSLKVVGKIKKPLLLMAGELDDLITPDHVREIFEAANEPKKLVILKGIGHDYRLNDEEIPVVNQPIMEFLKENNL